MRTAEIAAFADARPKMGAESVAREFAAGASATELRELAEAYLADAVDRHRRARAKEVEQQAYMNALPQRLAEVRQAKDAQRQEEFRRAREKTDREHQVLFANPLLNPGDRSRRRDFRDWAGDRFDEWYRRGHEAAMAESGQALELFESDWYPAGPGAYHRDRRRRRHREHLWAIVESESRRVRLQTTRELLSTVFALGDGVRVTWGEATAAQHLQRIEMLTLNAAGIVEAATRHHAAVRMIEDGDVACLNELAASVTDVAA